MTKSTEERISHDEIRFLAIKCKNCGAEMVLDINEELQSAYVRDARPHTALKCGVCGVSVGTDFAEAVGSFVRSLGAIDKTEEILTLCFRSQAPE